MIRYRGGREEGRWNYEACGSLFFSEVVLRAFGMVLGGSRGLLCRLVMGILKHLELPNRAGLFGVVPQLAPGTRMRHLEYPPGSAMT